jgi:hypothetical protein
MFSRGKSLTIKASAIICDKFKLVSTYCFKVVYIALIFDGEDKNHNVKTLSFNALIIICCLNDLSKSLVE